MSLVYWTVDTGAVFPEHAHPHEQIVNMLDGELDVVAVWGSTHMGS